jgi:hypothetical protein
VSEILWILAGGSGLAFVMRRSAAAMETLLDSSPQERLLAQPRKLRIHLTESYFSLVLEGMTRGPAEVEWLLDTAWETSRRIESHGPQ